MSTSTNKVTENTSVQEHYSSDALIATGATLSVLILGGVLQFLSPNPEKMGTQPEVSQPITTYSANESNKDAESELAKPSSEMTEERPLVSEEKSFTETPTETAAAEPRSTEPVSVMEATVPTITDPATINQLNGQVYDTIDQNWTTTPTFTGNLVYQIQVNEAGAIASYDSINQAAKDYSNEIPLASLVASDSNSDKMAKFVVVFTPGGQLEVSPWMAN